MTQRVERGVCACLDIRRTPVGCCLPFGTMELAVAAANCEGEYKVSDPLFEAWLDARFMEQCMGSVQCAGYSRIVFGQH